MQKNDSAEGRTREGILQYINQADYTDLNEFIQAIVRRYHRLFPDFDIVFLSMPKGDEAQRETALRQALQMPEQADAPDGRPPR